MHFTPEPALTKPDQRELSARSSRALIAVSIARLMRDASALSLADAIADQADAETVAGERHQYALSRAAHNYAVAVFAIACEEADDLGPGVGVVPGSATG